MVLTQVNTKQKNETYPLTEYSKSKVIIEKYLIKNIKSIILRYATACGFSSRLRLDLVLNDFVTIAIKKNKIEILSNGKPKRPLIDVYIVIFSFFYSLGYLSKKIKFKFIMSGQLNSINITNC